MPYTSKNKKGHMIANRPRSLNQERPGSTHKPRESTNESNSNKKGTK